MERFRNKQIACRNSTYEHGTDKPDVAGWKCPRRNSHSLASVYEI